MSETLLMYGVLRYVELISVAEIEQDTREIHEIVAPFSVRLSEPSGKPVVLARKCHTLLAGTDRACVSWRIVTASVRVVVNYFQQTVTGTNLVRYLNISFSL